MKIGRLIHRVRYYGLRVVVDCVGRINHRLYMRLNSWLLKSSGLRLKGTPRYIASSVYFDDMDRINLGDNIVISSHVRFLTHDYSATTALRAIGRAPDSDIALQRGITVGDNVFIGLASIIMPNTVIGDDVIVGAGAVVRGNVPARSVVIGNPASVVMSIEEFAARAEAVIASGRFRKD